jgi:tRNA-guanine family transglycosylase
MGADIASTLDFPIKINKPSPNDISLNTVNAVRAAKLRNDNQMLLFASIHGNDPIIIRNIVRYLNRKADFDGFALGSLMPIYANYSLLIDLILALRREVPTKIIHVYGLAGPIISQLLAFLGVDTMDSASFVISASKKSYVVPGSGRTYPLKSKNLKTDSSCNCPVCKRHTLESVLDNRELLSFHNLWITWKQMEQFKIALKENRLKEYMKELFVTNGWARMALRYALYKIR